MERITNKNRNVTNEYNQILRKNNNSDTRMMNFEEIIDRTSYSGIIHNTNERETENNKTPKPNQ